MQILFDNWTGRYDDECLMPGDIVEAAMVYNFRENAGNQTDTMIQMSEVADIVGNLPIYDTIYKENRYSPWKYAGQCYPGLSASATFSSRYGRSFRRCSAETVCS